MMLQMILMLGLTGAQISTKTAQIHTCQWPNKCEASPLVAFTGGPISTCDFPKKCG